MSTALTIAGEVAQFVGVAIVYVELGAVSKLLRAKLSRRRDRTVQAASATLRIRSSLSASGIVRPGPPLEDAAAPVWISWLQRRIELLQEDVDQLTANMHEARETVTAHAEQKVASLRAELDTREEQRETQVRRSERRQKLGAVFVVLGLVLTVLGAVL